MWCSSSCFYEASFLKIVFSAFNKRQSQFEITHIPLDLIYFNHRAIQPSTFSQAWQRGCSTAGSATVSSDNCAVGDGEGCLEVPIQQMFLLGGWRTSRRTIKITSLEMQQLRERCWDQCSISHCMMRELLLKEKSEVILARGQRCLLANNELKDGWPQQLFMSMSPPQCYLSSCHHCQWVQSHSSRHPGTVEDDVVRLLF